MTKMMQRAAALQVFRVFAKRYFRNGSDALPGVVANQQVGPTGSEITFGNQYNTSCLQVEVLPCAPKRLRKLGALVKLTRFGKFISVQLVASFDVLLNPNLNVLIVH